MHIMDLSIFQKTTNLPFHLAHSRNFFLIIVNLLCICLHRSSHGTTLIRVESIISVATIES